MFERLTNRGRLAHRRRFVECELQRSAIELRRSLDRSADVWSSAGYADQADADAGAALATNLDAAAYAWHRLDGYLGELSAIRVAEESHRRAGDPDPT